MAAGRAPEHAAGIARALGDIARAKGMTQVARDAGLSRESLYTRLPPKRGQVSTDLTYDLPMTLDDANRADKLVEDARTRRPRWWGARRRAPSWFAGEELDLLQPDERLALHEEMRKRRVGSPWFLLVIALANLSNAVRGFESGQHRHLWVALGAGFILLAFGAWLYRRQSMVTAARRQLRERADWPLRLAGEK